MKENDMLPFYKQLAIPQSWAEAPNPLVEYCHRWSRDNAIKQNVISDTKRVIERFNKQNFALLTALAYPNADEPRISVINDFHLYLFLNDDIAEQDEDIGKQLRKIVPILRSHAKALTDGINENPSDPLCAFLIDIRTRLLGFAGYKWLHRFSRNVEDYLLRGTLVGAQNWSENHVPNLVRYEEQRKYDSSVFACQDLIEISEKFELPDEIFYRNDIQALKELSNLVVAYTNDLFSYHKEVEVFSSPNNIVHVVMICEKRSLSEAVDRVTDIINEKVSAFCQMEKALPDWPLFEGKMVTAYLRGLKAWMRGNIDWSIASGRYTLVNPHQNDYRHQSNQDPSIFKQTPNNENWRWKLKS